MTGKAKNGQPEKTIDFSGGKADFLANSDRVRPQKHAGCWTLDANSDWQNAFKNGNSCNIKSISLPDDVKASTYTSWHSWDDICGGYKVEDIPAGVQDYAVKNYDEGGYWQNPPCAVLFSAA
jgi:hypothetical protein